MSSNTRTAVGIGILIGLLLAAAVALWRSGPSEATVRRTVVTTIQDEAPASFLVTGTLDMRVTVRIDSSQFLTPSWLTYVLEQAQSGTAALMQGGAQTQVKVPGTVSYGFDVRTLEPSMVDVGRQGVVEIDLPALSIHSVEPDLGHLEVRSETSGWLKVLPSDTPEAVRTQALAAVEGAFRAQAERRIKGATQPRLNTARALKAMLRPALKASGLSAPRFRIRINESLVLEPEE